LAKTVQASLGSQGEIPDANPRKKGIEVMYLVDPAGDAAEEDRHFHHPEL